MSSDVLRQLVEFSLPKPCDFGEENFAGDDVVQSFCSRLTEALGLEVSYFVSWACPPDVSVISTPVGQAVVRSERLDTLLVEYHNLQRAHHVLDDSLATEVLASAALRWLSEFLIGYRQPGLALLAQRLRPKLDGLRWTSPFRDETLASIPELERAALQCVCLAHEIGHLQWPRRPEATLDHEFDGLPLAEHIAWGDRETSNSEQVLTALSKRWRAHLDAPTLVSEIEADLFSLYNVVEFQCNVLGYSLEQAFRATLRAFEAQLFVCMAKNTARLLVSSLQCNTSKAEFLLEDYLLGTEYLARARAVARRAGILWAIGEQPHAAPGTRQYDEYVRRIDALIIEVQPFTQLASATLVRSAHLLFDTMASSRDRTREWLDKQFEILESDSRLRLDMFEILIAFGCPGSVDVTGYLRRMQSTTAVSTS